MKKGQYVIYEVRGSAADYDMSEKQYEKLLKHDGKVAKIISDEQLIIYDILKNVIDALTKEKDIYTQLQNVIPAYIVKKVEKNYLPEEVNDAVNEYGELLPEIVHLQKVLKEYDDSENLALKNKVKSVYDVLNGNFKEKVRHLVELLSENHKKDDLYIFYTRVVIIYFFERCVVGDNPNKEVKSDNTPTRI